MTKRAHYIEVVLTARVPFERGNIASHENAFTVARLVEAHQDAIANVAGVACCHVTKRERAEKA